MIKSIKNTWALFAVEDNAIGAHLTMIATPLILSFGVTLVLLNFIPFIPAIIIGLLTLIAVAYLMGWNNQDENDLIARRLANTDTSHIYPGEFPHQYLGPKRWIALGRADPDVFLKAILERDPHLRTLPYGDLRKTVEYTYMADTFSARNSSPAIRYVPAFTKGAYPVTHLKPPYDYFVDEKDIEKEISTNES